MRIILYTMNCEKNKVDKLGANDLTLIKEIDGNFRAEIDILNPTIAIDTIGLDASSKYALLHLVNYIYVSDIGRYYFVNNIRILRTNIIEYTCHVDVLNTYKQYINDMTAKISRTEDASQYNLYLDDPRATFNDYASYEIIEEQTSESVLDLSEVDNFVNITLATT